MNDILTFSMKNKVIRVINFCESENIQFFAFTEMVLMADYSIKFDLDGIDEYWNLTVTIQYLDLMLDDEDIKDDQEFFYRIEGEEFIVVDEYFGDIEEDEYDFISE